MVGPDAVKKRLSKAYEGRRITSGLALSSPPLTCAGSQIATNPGDQDSAAQCGQGEVRPDIEGHGAPPRSYWAPQPQPALYSVWAQAAVAGSTQWLTMLKGGRAVSVFEAEAAFDGRLPCRGEPDPQVVQCIVDLGADHRLEGADRVHEPALMSCFASPAGDAAPIRWRRLLPSSADSFIHLDVGSVRAWPRMEILKVLTAHHA